MRLGNLAVIAALLAFSASTAAAMTFEKVAGLAGCGERTCIAATGAVDEESVRAFERFVSANDVAPGALVVLASDGGNVMQSLRLGTQLRKLGATTIVGRVDPATGSLRGAQCVSACVYIFLGGVERRLTGGAKLGVHQVAAPADRPWTLNAEDSQWVMALVATHLNTMGAKLDLLALALRTRPRDMRYLSHEELVRYAVVTAAPTSGAD